MKQTQRIGFIGAGNMAASIIQGLVATGYSTNHIAATVRSQQRALALSQALGIDVSTDNPALAAASDILVLAVKPQQMRELAQEIAPIVQTKKPLIISVAVGVTIALLQTWLGDTSLAIVRSMPNTPALVGAGASGLFANAAVTQEQRDSTESIHRAVGITVWLNDEEQINAVASLSGSGPAYFFYFIEAMERAGVVLGLDSDVARLLSLQTALGASRLALESDEDVAVLRKKVTSPKGTTEQAINVFDTANLSGIVEEAMRASRQRAQALTQHLN